MPTSISLRVSAALLLVVCCSAAATAQEVPRKKKNLTRADRAAWGEVLRWPGACESDFGAAYANDERYAGLEFHALGRGLYLVEVVCDGGGIQPSTVFALYDERRPRRARLLNLRGFVVGRGREGARPFEVRALTKFDARARELSLMSKYDAMGTCGLFVRYRFTARGRPRVVEAREQNDCGAPGSTPDAGRWPRKRV